MGGAGREVGMAEKGQREESSWEWKCHDSLTVTTLAGILYYDVERCHH